MRGVFPHHATRDYFDTERLNKRSIFSWVASRIHVARQRCVTAVKALLASWRLPFLALIASSESARAQQAGSPDLTRAASDDQGVVEINDPTSPLRWFQLSDWYNASLHDQSGSINDVVFRTVLPFTVGGNLYAMRFTEQYTVSAYNAKTGGQDPEFIFLRVIDEAWGRWLVGMVVKPPTGAESQTSHAWELGPALGLTTSSAASVQYGAYLRAWWSVDAPSNVKPVGIINVQPVVNIKLGNGQALSLGQSQLEYDTEKGHWKSLQLGVKYDRAFTIGGRKWAPYVETDYDFANIKGSPMWTIRVGITMFEARRD